MWAARPRLEKVLARLHVNLQRKLNAQNKHEIQQHDQPNDGRELQENTLNREDPAGPRFTFGSEFALCDWLVQSPKMRTFSFTLDASHRIDRKRD